MSRANHNGRIAAISAAAILLLIAAISAGHHLGWWGLPWE